MGSTVSSGLSKLFPKKQFKILIFGLNSAGKTTLLYKLKLNEIINACPTIGFNVENIEFNNNILVCWDAFSNPNMKKLHYHYYKGTDGMIFVVDSSDKESVEEAKIELKELLKQDPLKNAPLLVIANKQDIATMNHTEIAEKLELYELKDRKWQITSVCSLSGEGLYQSFEWLSNTLSRKTQTIDTKQKNLLGLQYKIKNFFFFHIFRFNYSLEKLTINYIFKQAISIYYIADNSPKKNEFDLITLFRQEYQKKDN